MITLEQKRFLFDRVEMNHGLIAEAGSELDKKLQELEATEAIKCYDSMFGNRYYDLTVAGRKALRP